MEVRRLYSAANYRVAGMSCFSLQVRQHLPLAKEAKAREFLGVVLYFGTNTNSPFSTLMSFTLSGSFNWSCCSANFF
jgi:hypothetical protein